MTKPLWRLLRHGGTVIVPHLEVGQWLTQALTLRFQGHHHVQTSTLEELAHSVWLETLWRTQRQRLPHSLMGSYLLSTGHPLFSKLHQGQHLCEQLIEMFRFGAHPDSWFLETQDRRKALTVLQDLSKDHVLPGQLLYEQLLSDAEIPPHTLPQNLYVWEDLFPTPLERLFLDRLGRYRTIVALRAEDLGYISGQGSVQRKRYKDAHEEVEDVVRAVLSDLESPHGPSDIALLFRQRSAAAPMAAMLERANVPYLLAGGQPLFSTPLGQAVREYLTLVHSRRSRNQVLRALASLHRDSPTETLGSFSDWDQWTMQSHIRSFSAPAWEKRIMALKGSDTLKQQRLRFIEEVAAYLESLTLFERATDLPTALAQFLKNFVLPRIPPEDPRVPDVESLYSRLIELPGFMTRLNAASQLEALNEWLTQLHIPKRRTSFPRVRLSTYERTLGCRFDKAYLPQCHRGELPRRYETKPWIQAQQEQRRREHHQTLEQSLFLCAGNSASDISISYHDEPSVYLDLLPPDAPQTTEPLPPICIDSVDWISKHGLRISPFALAANRWNIEHIQTSHLTAYDGMVGASAWDSGRAYTASLIETYAKCPYRAYLAHLLRLEEELDPETLSALTALDRGTLMHAVLERVGREWLAGQEVSPEALDTFAHEIFAHFEEHVGRGLGYFWDFEKRLMIHDLKSYLAIEQGMRSTWKVLAVEHSFNVTDLSLDGLPLSLKGRIDRIDATDNPKHLRVIDYKTGSGQQEYDNRFQGGQRLQIPLYLLATHRLHPKVPLESISGELHFVSLRAKLKRVRFEGATLERTRVELREALDPMLAALQSGLYFPNPGPGMNNCKQCPYTWVCGPDIGRRMESKHSDPRVHVLRKLSELD